MSPEALDAIAPTVVYATPANRAAGIGTNARLTVTFSEPMTASSLTTAVSLMDETTGAPVALEPGSFDLMNRILTVTPSTPLAPNHVYRATVSTAVQDLVGNAMASPYAWTFGSGSGPDTTAPTVSSHAPASGATNVPTQTTVAMAFSEPMDAASVATAFSLSSAAGAVSGRLAYVGQAAVFTPDSPLAPSTAYVATLRNTAADMAGNGLAANVSWTFTTVANTGVGGTIDSTPPTILGVTPAPESTGVSRTPALTVTFDEPIYPFVYGTIDGVVVEVAIDYSTHTARLIPTVPLRAGARYTGSVMAADLSGNTMSAPYTWSFVTGP